MEFSEAYEYSGSPPAWSPDGKHLASPLGQRLVVRDAHSLRVKFVFTCLDRVRQLEWCPRSARILCSLHGRSVLQIWSLSKPEWECKINQGAAGIAACQWSPDGRHVLVASEFGIRCSVWAIGDRTVTHLHGSKHALHLSPNGSWLAVAERTGCKDVLNLTSTSTWRTICREPTQTRDLAGLAWNPATPELAVWDSALTYKVLLFSSQGSLKASYLAYADALGVRHATWSPSGQLLAVGSCDRCVRLLERATFKPLATLEHVAILEGVRHGHVTVYHEQEALQRPHGAHPSFRVASLPVTLPEGRSTSHEGALHLPGIGRLHWSPDGRWLATVDDCLPRVVWLWDVARLGLSSVVVFHLAVQDMLWHPTLQQLAVAINSPSLYVWCPDGMTSVRVPMSAFRAGCCMWSPHGNVVLLQDLDRFVVAFIEADDDPRSPEP